MQALPHNTMCMKLDEMNRRRRIPHSWLPLRPLPACLALVILTLWVLAFGCLSPGMGSAATGAPSVAPGANRPSGSVLFTFIDVGQGDAILVSTSDGRHMLVDGGPRAAGPLLAARLRELGVGRLDVLVSTHPHEDHIGGLIDVLNAVEVGRVIDSGKVHTSATYERYLPAIDKKNIRFTLGRANDWFRLGEAKVTVLWPAGALAEDLNDTSIVLRVDYGESSALLAGDIGPGVEQYLCEQHALNRIVLLKVAHHGSRRSTIPEFLRQAKPRIAVIQCAAGNSYGHPHYETLAKLILNQVLIYRTDEHGEVSVRLTPDAKAWSATMEKRGADYRASSASTVFHFPWCDRAKGIDPARTVVFGSRLQAEDAGYRPCTVCKP